MTLQMPTVGESSMGSGSTTGLEFLCAEAICFAMEHAGVPILRDLSVLNTGTDAILGAELAIQLLPDLGVEQRQPLPRIDPKSSVQLSMVDFRLAPTRLRTLRERERAELRVRVMHSGVVLGEKTQTVDVLAFNEWPGTRAPIGLVVAFALPNHPLLPGILSTVSTALGSTTGVGALDSYQSRSPRRVHEQLQALYEVLRGLEVGYAPAPASFEASGQKVRLVDDVLEQKLANCLDISLVAVGLMEAMGLNPLLIIEQGHAYVGAWLKEERFPEGIVEDTARLRTLRDLGQVEVFDPTVALGHPDQSFDHAVAAAVDRIQRGDKFIAALDVRVMRTDGFRPLSIRDAERAVPSGGTVVMPARFPPDGAGRTDPDSPKTASAQTAHRFEKWKERLLDLTLRNKLLNFRLSTRGALPLEVPDAAKFEDLLAAGRAFELLPPPTHERGDPRDPNLVRAREDASEKRTTLLRDLDAAILHTPLEAAELWNRAVHLDRTARSDLEEGGATTLYAAIGLIRWYEDARSEEPRLAPLLLYPVQLEFERRKRRIHVRRLDDDPIANQTLIEKLRREYEVDLSGLSSIEADESGLDVPAMLGRAREAVQQMPRWEILDQVHLGHFTFTKFLMWRDLHDNAAVLLENPVVRHIAERDRPMPAATRSFEPESLDDEVHPADIPCVVDADSSQLSAIQAALNNTGLVLQGPPGTGKSQTITNLIAATLARGETVLFVSEKMAALDVVFRRLQKVGLGDFCLELHSHKSNKKQVLESFRQALERKKLSGKDNWSQVCDELEAARTQLNGYARALHSSTLLGMTFYDASSRLEQLSAAPIIEVPLDRPDQLDQALHKTRLMAVQRFAEATRTVEPVAEHPWLESGQDDWSIEAERRLPDLLQRVALAIQQTEQSSAALASTLGVTAPRKLDETRQLLAHANPLITELGTLASVAAEGPLTQVAWENQQWSKIASRAEKFVRLVGEFRKARAAIEARWTPDLYHLDIPQLHATFLRWATAFFLFAWIFLMGSRRQLRIAARGELPTNLQIARDLGAVRELPERERELEKLDKKLDAELGETFRYYRSNLRELGPLLARSERARVPWTRLRELPAGARFANPDSRAWAASHLELTALGRTTTAAVTALMQAVAELDQVVRSTALANADFSQLHALVDRWKPAVHAFRAWCQYRAQANHLGKLGLDRVVQEHAARRIDAQSTVLAYERAVLTKWQSARLDATPELRSFNGQLHHHDVKSFVELDRSSIELARDWLARKLEARIPSTDGAVRGSELELLSREIKKKARHLAVRKLLEQLPEVRTRLKPCLLMSPLSVAQYLPPKASFDLVVFDEASQIETHDAIGALARGKRVVVVGDSKQLPPTRFFTRMQDEEGPVDENDVEDVESILDEAVAKRLPERSLGWHYRSRHDALIEFSNRHYYDDRLQVFPAAERKVDSLGISWHRVEGVYYSGGAAEHQRTNPVEAGALVDYLSAAVKRTPPSERTYGIVTFSLTQAELIRELLDQRRAQEPALEAHLANEEELFIKNLENVQGDERDEILFSIGYAPDERGRLRHHFGPLSNEGGERRLNVAVTRARMQLRVFCSMGYERIEMSRTAARGAAHLREFLRFAQERGDSRPPVDPAPTFDSEFEREVYDTLVRAGHSVHTKIGCGSYKLDMAVVHPNRPGTYALAIECDGPTYSSAPTARDRDRLRASVLGDLRWELHRIWSLDWLLNRDAEVHRLLTRVGAALAVPEPVRSAPEPEPAQPAPEPGPHVELPEPVVELTPRAPDATSAAEPYVVAALPLIPEVEFHSNASARFIPNLLVELVRVEGPIHREAATRAVMQSFGAVRLTERAAERIQHALTASTCREAIVIRGDFLWHRSVDPADYRRFRGALPNLDIRDAEEIAPEEVANAMGSVLEKNLALPTESLVRETARLFGYQRLREKTIATFSSAVQVLVQRGDGELEGDRVIHRERVPSQQSPPPVPSSRAPSAALSAADPLSDALANSARFQTRAGNAGALTLGLVRALLAAGGRSSFEALAKALGQPTYRIRSFTSVAKEHLNVDQYPVIRDDTNIVELDREKLAQAFDLRD